MRTKKTFLIYVFMILGTTLISQSFYYCDTSNGVGTIDISDTACVPNFKFAYDDSFGDIAFSPDGRMFGVRGRRLYDISNGGLIYIGDFASNVNSLTCNSNNIIYGAGLDRAIHTYDLNTGIFTRLGFTPFPALGDLTFRDGKLYMVAENNNIILVDINNPTGSELFMNINPIDTLESFFSIVTFAVDCDSVVTYALGGFLTPGVGFGTRIYSIDFENKTTSLICSVPIRMFGAASPLEFLASDCELVVDLDIDNSSGALVHDFQADSTCTTPARLTDEDVEVFAQIGTVDSLRIHLYAGAPDGVQEYLSLPAAAGITVIGDGTGSLLLRNDGSASPEDFEAAIRMVQYFNDTPTPTPGVRQIGFRAYAQGDSSELATAFLPLGFGSANAGMDGTLALCPDAPPTDLFAQLNGTPDTGGVWQPATAAPGIFDPARDMPVDYQYIVSGDGCGADTAMVSITLLPEPIFTLGEDFVICLPDTNTYTFEPMGLLPGNYAYQWNDGTTQPTQTLQGYDEYWVIVTNEQGCSAADTLMVTRSDFAETVQLNFRVFNNVSCNGGEDGRVLALGAINAETFLWSNGSTTPQAHGDMPDQWLSAGAYSLTVTDEFGCAITDSIEITEPEPLTLNTMVENMSGDCNSTAALSAAANGGTAPYNLIWSDGTMGEVIMVDSSGDYNVTLTDANGCEMADTVSVTVQSGETIMQQDTAHICAGEGYTFGNQTLTEGGTYADTLQTVNGCDSIINLTLNVFDTLLVEQNVTICAGESFTFNGESYNESGNYTATLQTVNGCDSNIILNLEVLPISNTSIDTSICTGQSLAIGNETFATSGNYEVILQNSVGCDSIINLNLNVSENITQNITADICAGENYAFGNQILTESGIYTDTLQTMSGCDSIVMLRLNVFPVSSLNIIQEGVLCNDMNAILQIQEDVTDIRWSNGAITPSIEIQTEGIYRVQATDKNGCSVSDSIIVNELNIDFDFSLPALKCGDSLGILQIDTVFGGEPPYLVAIDGNAFADQSRFDLSIGSHEVMIEDAQGCQTSRTLEVVAPSVITLDLGADRTFRPNEAIQINAQTNAQQPFTILWQPSDFLDCDTCLNVTARPSRNITYNVTIIDDDDCVASDSISLQLFNKNIAYAPNAFSPNGDGVNDFFTIYSGNNVQQIKLLRIFDRWGELVFERANLAPGDEQQGWNGTFGAKNMPNGVYVFYAEIEVEGAAQLIEGELSLVR